MERKDLDNVIRLMSGNFNMNDFTGEIMQIINNKTQEKFVNDIKKTLNNYKTVVTEESDREIKLLNAFKPFINQENQGNIDKVTEMLSNFKAIDRMVKDIREVTSKNENSAKNSKGNKKVSSKSVTNSNEDLIIEKNTVYELDKDCQRKIQKTDVISTENLLPLILIFLLLFNDHSFNKI